MSIDLNIVSHLVLDDKVFYSVKPSKKTYTELGGPISFASSIIPLLPKKIVGITSFGKDFPQRFLQYFSSIENLNLKYFYSDNTTRFLHEIFEDRRNLFLLSQAQKLDGFLQSQNGGKSCLLSPVFNEISKSSINWATENHNTVGVDIQGFIRIKSDENKILISFNRKYIQWIIQAVDIVKFSYNEAAEFTKQESLREILQHLPQNNTQIVTMGDKGLAYSDKGKYYLLSAPARIEKDPTGAGDVLMTYILAKMEEAEDIGFALAFGMALAAEKITYYEINILPDKNYQEIAEKIFENREEI